MSEEVIIESQLIRLNLELLRYVMHFVGHDPIQPLKEVNKYFNEKIKLFEKCKKYKSYYYEWFNTVFAQLQTSTIGILVETHV